MEQARNDRREAILWAVGLPLAVVAATLTLLGLLSAINHVDHSSRDLSLSLFLVRGFGVPAALIARAVSSQWRGNWAYYALAGTIAGLSASRS